MKSLLCAALAATMLFCCSTGYAQTPVEAESLDWSMIKAPPAAQAIEANTLDFCIIKSPLAAKAPAKPVLEIVYGDNCQPCQRIIRSYNGDTPSKPTRLRQFLEANFEVRWVKYDRSEMERRRFETLAKIAEDNSVPLFSVNGGEASIVGFKSAEELIAALKPRLEKPVSLRPSH